MISTAGGCIDIALSLRSCPRVRALPQVLDDELPAVAARRPPPTYLAWLISRRCPSGSVKKARTSQSDSTGGVRNSAPRARRLSYAARQSATRKVIAWLTRFGSLGTAKVTCGLSSVGPPPVTRSSQVPASFSTHDV